MDTHALASIGHNSGASLAEILAEETAPIRKRADDLIAATGRASVTDEQTAGFAVTLAKQLKICEDAAEDARKARKEPFLAAGKTVDGHFSAITSALKTARTTVTGMIDAFRREQQRAADAERRRLEDEARQAAEAARVAAEAARQAEAPTIEDEIAVQQAAEHAAFLAAQAKAVSAPVIDSGYGAKASGRTTYKATITDPKTALKHAWKIDEASILAAVQSIYDKQVRAGIRVLPGATVEPVTTTVIR